MKLLWRGKLNPKNLSKSKIPENATYFYHPKFKFEYYVVAIPIIIVGIALLFIKSKFIEHGMKSSPLGKYLGLILIIPSFPIHELLHAIAFPAKAEVEMFYCNAGLGVATTYPTPKWRYIFSVFFPSLVLGIVPFIFWFFIPHNYAILDSAIYIFAIGNLAASAVDFTTIIHAIIEVPKEAVIQGCGVDSFWHISN